MRSPVAWDASVPGDGFSGIDILYPKCDEKLAVVLWSDRIVGAWVHWLDGRTFPCERVVGNCRLCGERAPRRWRGFLWCQRTTDPALSILQVTAYCAWPHQSRLNGHREPLPGCLAVVRREKGSKCGRMTMEITKLPCVAVPARLDLPKLEEVLLRIWYGAAGGLPSPDDDKAGGAELIPLPGH